MKKTAKELFDEALNLYDQGNLKEAIDSWEKISDKEDSNVFAYAQFNLGITYFELGELSKAIECYKNITTDSSDLSSKAALNLLGAYILNDDLESTKEILIKKIDQLAKDFGGEYKYRFDIVNEILNSNLDDSIKLNLCKIDEYVHSILSLLRLDDSVESKLAHYTSPSTGFILLSGKDNAKFRLNTIKGMNDPTEGIVLEEYLNLKHAENRESLTFISCFTFNHDSLNQFRLYGKEKGEEASGISLVFDYKKFFEPDEKHKYLSIMNYNEKTSISREENLSSGSINKLPLYRCIYLEDYDDGSFYISLAQRDEITFYRENKSGNKKNRFNKYKMEMEYKRTLVEKYLIRMNESVSKLDLNRDVNYFLDKILLPLKYLVKHSAFREEQECRIIYISHFDDEEIYMENIVGNEKMYIEYRQNVLEAIHKIYLSPGAERYKDYFRKLLKDSKGEKVFSSRNPFRAKK